MNAKPQDGFSMKYYLEKFPKSFKISGVAGTLAVYAQLGEPPTSLWSQAEQAEHADQVSESADISAENSEFLKQFNSFSDKMQHATCNFTP